MDGKTATRAMQKALNASGFSGSYLNHRDAYEYLDEAAADFARRTLVLSACVEITTVEDQARYDLPPDYLELQVKDSNRRYFGIFEDAEGNKSHPVLTEFERIRRNEDGESQDVPVSFAVEDKRDRPLLVAGSTTGAGVVALGEAVLTDLGASFTGEVQVRDVVHNTTQEYSGIVLAVNSGTALTTALFDDSGSPVGWGAGDGYSILPMSRRQVVLDAPSGVAGSTLTLDYVCLPGPMSSEFSFWRFGLKSCHAMAKEAAALFLDSQKEWDVAQGLHLEFAREIDQVRREIAFRSLRQGRRK